MQSHSISRRQNQHNDYNFINSSEEEAEHSNQLNDISANGSNTSNAVRSEVVHETRTNAYEPHKQYHVSKVYFYSVSDMILNGEGTEEVERNTNKIFQELIIIILNKYILNYNVFNRMFNIRPVNS
jgi:purine-nucleoside phosphorylase